jgi:TonB-linked SusC/RagA family outer membrane protein
MHKWVMLILIISCSFCDLYGQEKVFSLDVNNISLSSFINIIENQSGYTFMYDNTLNDTIKVSVKAHQEVLDEVLKKTFTFTEISYLIIGRQIILKNKVSNEQRLTAPKIKVQATVTDQNGEPIIGVSVFENNTNNGTITNLQGVFTIETDINAKISFNHIAYIPIEIEAKKASSSRIVLIEKEISIDEIVVLGYGTALKKDLTGAVSSISSETLRNQSMVKDFLQSLQGQVAGADITTQNAPGDGSTIHIRGYNSLNASNAPLVVLDDAPFSGKYSDLNPNEIEKIDILKDASSTAIYGSRGANGVIIITTKRGSERGLFSAEYNGYYGVGKTAGRFNMMDGEQFLRFKIASLSPFDAIQNRVIESGNYIDWQKLMFSSLSQKTEHSITVNMGVSRTRSTLMLGYNNEQGIIDNMTFRRLSGRFTSDLDINDALKFGYSASITHSQKENGDANVWRNGTLLDPITELYNEKGEMRLYNSSWNLSSLRSNPIFDTKRENVDNQSIRDRILGNAYISWTIIDDLIFRSSFTYDFTGAENGAYYGSLSQLRSGASSAAYYHKPTERSYNITNNIGYSKKINDHSFKLSIVHDMQKASFDEVGVTGYDLPYSGLWYNVNEAQLNIITHANRWDWAILSFMGRLNYSIKDKYLFTFTGRADGSSKLAKGHKWGFFPSSAFAWRINEEEFMRSVFFLTNLKMRVGWGVSGNTSINAYATSGRLGRIPYNFGLTSDNSAIGYLPVEIPNPALGWERTSEINIGLDFGLLKNRLAGSVDIYKKHTYDLLMKRNLPTTSGYSEVWQNVGQTQNRGVELALQTTIITNKNVTWTANLTFNVNENKIVSLFNGSEDSPSNKWFVGQPIDVEWITKYVGVWQEHEAVEAELYSRLPGQSKFFDANNDKVIDQSDYFIYNKIPKLVGGLSTSLTYKQFDFSIYSYSRLNYGSLMGIINIPDFPTANWNQLRYNFWTVNNPTNDGPMPAETRDAYTQGSSYAFRDLSFVRIKNINAGYTISTEMLSKYKLNSLRVFVVLDNPFLFTRKDYIGIDPENANSPMDARPLRSIAIGINAKM